MSSIKINNYVTFEDVTTYSQNDKIRNKRSYEANVSGLVIRVTNLRHGEGKMQYICKGLGIEATFTNVNISFEAACKVSVKDVNDKLLSISKMLISTT